HMNALERQNGLIEKAFETVQNTAHLISARNAFNRYNQEPGDFWRDEEAFISRGLAERYILADHPEHEIMIPVHKNAVDLPPLLHSLASQNLDRIGPTQLTFIMHNNSGSDGTERDLSWDLAQRLGELGAPIKLVEFSDPLLTGPYAAWQFALAKNSATDTVAVLDADSIVPENWFRNLTRALREDQQVLITGGERIYINGSFQASMMSLAFYLLCTSKYIAQQEGPHLIRGRKLHGGQAAYRGSFIREAVYDILGFPSGDNLLGDIIYDTQGANTFNYANSPALNVPDSYRDYKSFATYMAKVKKGIVSLLPPDIARKVSAPQTRVERNIVKLGTVRRYCPWAHDIVEEFNSSHKLTAKEVVKIFAKTAQIQHFSDNVHVRQFLQEGIACFKSDQELDAEAVAMAIDYIGYRCLGPTMKDHLSR
ncbi:glycosyltransferase, partial [Candidatus Roizmanbacteria bacterium]|nr:glycosyltransferase [Candidatus Roizmanbacteria bacterium]